MSKPTRHRSDESQEIRPVLDKDLKVLSRTTLLTRWVKKDRAKEEASSLTFDNKEHHIEPLTLEEQDEHDQQLEKQQQFVCSMDSTITSAEVEDIKQKGEKRAHYARDSPISTNEQISKNLSNFHENGKHHVRCEICFTNLGTVRLYTDKQLPAIVLECGTIYRKRTIHNHIETMYHKEAVKSRKLKIMSPEKMYEIKPMSQLISSANEKIANKIGALMLQVYNDAKKLTLSAYSWPSRIVASDLA
eukprot:gene10342-11418_t